MLYIHIYVDVHLEAVSLLFWFLFLTNIFCSVSSCVNRNLFQTVPTYVIGEVGDEGIETGREWEYDCMCCCIPQMLSIRRAEPSFLSHHICPLRSVFAGSWRLECELSIQCRIWAITRLKSTLGPIFPFLSPSWQDQVIPKVCQKHLCPRWLYRMAACSHYKSLTHCWCGIRCECAPPGAWSRESLGWIAKQEPLQSSFTRRIVSPFPIFIDLYLFVFLVKKIG